MRCTLTTFVVLLALYLVACSKTPKTAEVEASQPLQTATEPSGPVTGKTAYWAIYKSAYSWAKDSVPLRLESKSLAGIKNDAGAAGLWSGTFGSPSRKEAIEISYAVAPRSPDIVKGLNVGHAIPWSGPTREVMPFAGSDIVADSDAAFKVASGQAASWLKTHQDKPVSFLMGNNGATFATPVWFVMWGDKKDGYSVFVNTKSGEVAKRAK